MTKKLISTLLTLLIVLGCVTASYVYASDITILNKLTMEVGDETDLTFSDPQGNKISVSWKSEDTSICTVSDKGVVKGLKAGVCTVYTKWNGNLYGVKITVKEEEKPTPFNIIKNYLVNNGKEHKDPDEGNDHYRLWEQKGMHLAINYNENGIIDFFIGKPKENSKLGDLEYDYGVRLFKSKGGKNSARYYKITTATRQYAAKPKKGKLNIGNGLEFKKVEGSKSVKDAKKKANKLLLKAYPLWNDYLQRYTGMSMKDLGITCKTTSLSQTKLTLYVNTSITLKLNNATASKVKWSSSNKKIAKVSSKGKITALKKGSATITAKYDSKSYKCKLTVKQ